MSPRLFLACLALGASATPVFAHAFLERAVPGAGATLSAPPNRIVLTFAEKLEPTFSGVTVTDSSGHGVEAGPVWIGGNAMAVPLRRFSAGTYRVTWHAVSVDTHRTEGAYSFTVK